MLPPEQAPAERDRCASAREDHRIQQANLSETARANELAERNFTLAAQQARAGVVQTLATVLAFVAAAAAAIFAGIAAHHNKRNAEVADKALKLAHNEYIASHRPKIRVRNINVKHQAGEDIRPMDGIRTPKIGDRFDGQFYVANVGTGDAQLVDGYIGFYASKSPLPMARPYEGANGNLGIPRAAIPPGGSSPVLFDFDLDTWYLADRKEFIDPALCPIYAMGWIEYKSANSDRVRRTAFCRKYDSGKVRFVIEDDVGPDYEAEE